MRLVVIDNYDSFTFTLVQYLGELGAECDVVRNDVIPVEEVGRRPGDPSTLIGSSDKARKVLGWKPRFADLSEIIGTAWAWHKTLHTDILTV